MMGWDGMQRDWEREFNHFSVKGKPTYFWFSHYIGTAAAPKLRYSGENEWPGDGEEKCHIHIA